jgi:hypothetical protein
MIMSILKLVMDINRISFLDVRKKTGTLTLRRDSSNNITKLMHLFESASPVSHIGTLNIMVLILSRSSYSDILLRQVLKI